jgi:hypothetical protein
MLLRNFFSAVDEVNFLTLSNYAAISFFLGRAIYGDVEFLYLGMFFGLLVFYGQLINKRSLPPLVIAFIVIVLMSYVVTFSNNNLDIGAIFIPLTLSHIGVAWRISTHGLSYNFSKIIFFGSLAYFFYSVVFLSLSPNEIFANSRNYISVYFLNTVSILYISIYLSRNLYLDKLRVVVPAALVFIVSVFAVGTMGIFTSFILLTLVILIFIKKSYFFFWLLLSILTIYYFPDWNSFISFLSEFQFFNQDKELLAKMDYAELMQENTRYYIWNEYINSMDTMRFLSGINLSEHFYGFNNYHNSFILLHARIGVYMFIIVFIFVYSLIKLCKVNAVLASCLFVILLRSLSDTSILAGSAFDFILFYLVFFLASNKKKVLK